MNKLAILSVFDKTDLKPFAKGLQELGVEFLSTGGTAAFLEENGIPVLSISEYTGHPEILDGRVKSLHPKIHGGILARRDRQDDALQLRDNDIRPIDFVVVNLYPFTNAVAEVEASGKPNHSSLVEMIDIGGPTMIRAAAKNCSDVVVICDPGDYERVLAELREHGDVTLDTRRALAAKVFATMAAYDGAIARYFSLGEQLLDESGAPNQLAPFEARVFQRDEMLRYGENPHQKAASYTEFSAGQSDKASLYTKLQGKEISYNNLLDIQAAAELFIEIYARLGDEHAAVVIKHTNPCGVAIRPTPLEAFKVARECDPLSAFGGIVALSGTLDEELAATILEGFVEVVIAGDITPEARAAFEKKKNVRLMHCDFRALSEKYHSGIVRSDDIVLRPVSDGFVFQTPDRGLANVTQELHVAGPAPTDKQLRDLNVAWEVCKHVKSNTIVVVKDRQAIGIGAGQMSRVDAARIALERAKIHGHDVAGAVAASDAFLPFPDTLETLNDAGVVALIQPGGSIKDDTVIESANQRKVSMLFTGQRHFRH